MKPTPLGCGTSGGQRVVSLAGAVPSIGPAISNDSDWECPWLADRLYGGKPVAWKGREDLPQVAWSKPTKGSWFWTFGQVCVVCVWQEWDSDSRVPSLQFAGAKPLPPRVHLEHGFQLMIDPQHILQKKR